MAVNFFNKDAVHAVAESSKLKATTAGHIFNIKATADIDNGCIVGKGAYQGNDYYAEAAATTFKGVITEKAANGNWYVEVTSAVNAYLVLTAPLIYENYTKGMQDPKYFYNAAGDLVRAYELYAGDVFALSENGFTGTPEAGKTVSVTSKKVSVDSED